MRVDRAGIPFIIGAFMLGVAGALTVGAVWSVPFWVAAAFFLFFFRDPDRTLPTRSDVVVSPADGRVLVAGEARPEAPPGSWRQISIFLSPMEVHVNRIPWSGRVTRVERRPGRFLPAYRADAGAQNEQSEIWVERDGRVVVFRQIVGVLARRVVCRLEPGRIVRAGDRFGIMKFGSRMDVFVPVTATLRVSVGDAVRGAESVLAEFGDL